MSSVSFFYAEFVAKDGTKYTGQIYWESRHQTTHLSSFYRSDGEAAPVYRSETYAMGFASVAKLLARMKAYARRNGYTLTGQRATQYCPRPDATLVRMNLWQDTSEPEGAQWLWSVLPAYVDGDEIKGGACADREAARVAAFLWVADQKDLCLVSNQQ